MLLCYTSVGSLILPDFLFARSSIDLMEASSFLGYIYTEVGKAGVNLRGEDLRLAFCDVFALQTSNSTTTFLS